MLHATACLGHASHHTVQAADMRKGLPKRGDELQSCRHRRGPPTSHVRDGFYVSGLVPTIAVVRAAFRERKQKVLWEAVFGKP